MELPPRNDTMALRNFDIALTHLIDAAVAFR
jgi:hypothetical protein